MSSTQCPIRLMELNKNKKPGPNNVTGSQSAMENAIRRRVTGNISKGYGPIFGIKGQTVGKCKNIYNSNSGDSSDVTAWKRIYGGTTKVINTSKCTYGCKNTLLKQ
jgi:hypothetical protein